MNGCVFKARSSTSSCLHISKSVARLGRRDDIVARKERKILPHVNVQEIKPVFVAQRSLCFEINNFSLSMVMNVYRMETDKQISPPSILFNSTTLGIYVLTNLPFQSGARW